MPPKFTPDGPPRIAPGWVSSVLPMTKLILMPAREAPVTPQLDGARLPWLLALPPHVPAAALWITCSVGRGFSLAALIKARLCTPVQFLEAQAQPCQGQLFFSTWPLPCTARLLAGTWGPAETTPGICHLLQPGRTPPCPTWPEPRHVVLPKLNEDAFIFWEQTS